ncbi:hypothetical protein ASPZODRAFT_1864875 [Penicilliopsis zonata CBS 506.65]|uniref:Uncharacterized protein n=1 Tax=Penicilliopsis zonata CBS 506.65 TaxID=1073090 RepID=A0A1L9SIJ2_9EURO|nr:hypothetical protein ASPZODRAFT_1864875 [Penicilliopsis zonata CBS 506.65]OJJ46967.1 hypothetical protein ASPZODRAFT_1864875 [Penicilliopsis zonata CBS 506.65]
MLEISRKEVRNCVWMNALNFWLWSVMGIANHLVQKPSLPSIFHLPESSHFSECRAFPRDDMSDH